MIEELWILNLPVIVWIKKIEKHFDFTLGNVSNLQVIECFEELHIIKTIASIRIRQFELSL